MLNVTVCGGGNLGHSISGKLSQIPNVEVSVLTSKPSLWNRNFKIIENNGEVSFAKIKRISNKPSDVISSNTHLVLIAVPSFLISGLITQIKPFVSSETWIGSVQCSGGFFLQMQDLFPKHQRVFGFQRVPYIARIKEYGESVYLKGYKDSLKIASIEEDTVCLLEQLKTLFQIPVSELASFWEVTLTNSNPILHPARLYDLFKDWGIDVFYQEEPLFYEAWTDRASENLVKCDQELALIFEKLGIPKIPTILEHYGVNSEKELTHKLSTIQAFQGIRLELIKTPNGYIPDFTHRYFIEDIPFGLALIYKIAKVLEIETPMLDEIYTWALGLISPVYFDNSISKSVLKQQLDIALKCKESEKLKGGGVKNYTDIQIESLNIQNDVALEWVRNSFLSKKYSLLPHKISQTFNDGKNFYNTMPAIMPTIDSVGVKVVSRYPERNPSVQGDLLLYRYSDGETLAMMQASWITTKRTGAVASLAVETFAKKDAQSIAVIGLGQTGRAFLDIYFSNKNNLNKTVKLMSYKDHAEKVKNSLKAKGVQDILICENYEDLIKDSDIIVSALTVCEGILGKDEWFKEGVLVVPIHTRGFQNCDLFFDKVFVDDIDHVKGFRYFNQFRYCEEFDRVLHQEVKGRENDKERILAYNIGIALHDIYFARKIYDLIN